MTAFKTILAGGVAIAALAGAAPAAAQSYPGYGYGYGGGAGIIGQVISSVIGGGYGNQGYNNGYGQNPYGGYGMNSQYAVSQCTGAVQQRLSAGYGYNNGTGYSGYGNGYGYNGGYQQPYGGGRVLGISRVEQRSNGGLTIRGVANSGRNAAYGYGNGYAGQSQVDLTFKCKTDARGYVVDIAIAQAISAYGAGNPAYTPYNNDYSQYGYRRY